MAAFHAAIWNTIMFQLKTNLRGRNSRKPLRIFKDTKSSKMVSPMVWVSLELSCSRVPQTRSIATFTSSATWRMKEVVCVRLRDALQLQTTSQDLFTTARHVISGDVPVSPAACMIRWGNLPSMCCGNKHRRSCVSFRGRRRNVPMLGMRSRASIFTCRRVCCRCSGLSAHQHTHSPRSEPASSAAPPGSVGPESSLSVLKHSHIITCDGFNHKDWNCILAPSSGLYCAIKLSYHSALPFCWNNHTQKIIQCLHFSPT